MKVKLRFIKYFVITLGLVGSLVAPASVSAALDVNPPQPITHIVTVQPIVVSDDDGRNTAEFFGTVSQRASIEGFIDDIWAQAGIDVEFVVPNEWNNTFANWGTSGGGNRPNSDLNQIIGDGTSAGVTHADPYVINIFFVKIAAGYGQLDENYAAGLAKVSGNGISQFVGNTLPGSNGGRELIASIVAHEIGHNLGLEHISEANNLMKAGGSGEILNSEQIGDAIASSFSVAVVPLPAAVWLFGAALLTLLGFRSRRG